MLLAQGQMVGEICRRIRVPDFRLYALGGMERQTLRDWVHRFNAEGPEGLIDHKAPSKLPKLNAEQKARLAAVVEEGPTPSVHGVVRWRLKDLVGWVWEEVRVTLSEQPMSRILR